MTVRSTQSQLEILATAGAGTTVTQSQLEILGSAGGLLTGSTNSTTVCISKTSLEVLCTVSVTSPITPTYRRLTFWLT